MRTLEACVRRVRRLTPKQACCPGPQRTDHGRPVRIQVVIARDCSNLSASKVERVVQRFCRAARVFGLLNEQRLYAAGKLPQKVEFFRGNGLVRCANEHCRSGTEAMPNECGCGDNGPQRLATTSCGAWSESRAASKDTLASASEVQWRYRTTPESGKPTAASRSRNQDSVSLRLPGKATTCIGTSEPLDQRTGGLVERLRRVRCKWLRGASRAFTSAL